MKIYLVRIKEDQEWKNKKMRQQKEHNDQCKYNDNILNHNNSEQTEYLT